MRMRRVPLVFVVLLTACGGKPAQPAQPIGQVAEPRRPDPWTLPRVLATVPDDTDVLFVWDSARVRRSPLVAPYWHQLAEIGQRMGGGVAFTDVCPRLVDTDATMMMALQLRSLTDFGAWVWAIGMPSAEYRDCVVKAAAARPDLMTVQVDGEVLHVEVKQPKPIQSSVLLVDDTTVLIKVGPFVDAPALRALLEPVARPIASAELDWLRAEDPEVWLVARPRNAGLAMFANRFVDVGAAIRITDRLAVEARVRMTSPAEADAVADKASSVLDQAVRSAFLDEAAATATDAVVTVTVAMEKSSILRLAGIVGAQLGGLTGVPIPMPAPPHP